MTNRITDAYRGIDAEIQEKLLNRSVTPSLIKRLSRKMNMDLAEFSKFQELKTLAVANETLTLEEGQTVYASLGETPSHFNSQPLHVKTVLTTLFRELLEAKISLQKEATK